MPEDIAKLVISELDHFQEKFHPNGGGRLFETQQRLLHEPFVAFVGASTGNEEETLLLVCRHYTPFDFNPMNPKAEFASYMSEFGRIIARAPGEIHSFETREHPVLPPTKQSYRLLRKNEFRPKRTDGRWDGIENRMGWVGRDSALIPSLRRLLAGDTEQPQRRVVQINVQLPDQAILDKAQDDIFRLALNKRIRISGAPGTGKTTVLLKRLSQKTKHEFLTEAEKQLVAGTDWQEGQSWMLFTPNDLLKAYLKEALAKELLPAGDDHIKVYSTFRLEALREIGFIRVGERGVFKIAADDERLLKRDLGTEHVSLTKDFGQNLDSQYSATYRTALQKFNNETREVLGLLVDANQKVLLTALDILAKTSGDALELRHAQERSTRYRKLNSDLTILIQRIREVGSLLDSATAVSLSSIYRQSRRLADMAPTLSLQDVDAALFTELPPLMQRVRHELRDLIEALSVSRLFQLIARAYQDFRTDAENQKRYFAEGAADAISQRQISTSEQNVLLFHALEFVRTLNEDFPPDLNGVPGQVRVLREKLRLLVAIDEATDFSALEIACMSRFASPKTEAVTICGDLMQRVTKHGLKMWDDLEILSPHFVPADLTISYRQTHRLFSIAKDLYEHVQGQPSSFRSAYSERPEDPPPLSFKSTKEVPVESWLADRVIEICELCEGRLPTTAILVPDGKDVEAIQQLLQSRLLEHGIQVDASPTGQSLGDSARVRVFPVECIKGLEFEAVFYVGLDRMADIHKDLLDKYFYVGLSRARNFLGVSYERIFPQRLQCISKHFVQQERFQGAVFA